MTKQTENPCNEANFIGNRMASSLDLVGPDKKSLRQKHLIGNPRQCAAGSAEEMKKRGYVGIYMKERVMRFRIPQSGLVLQQNW